MNPTEQNIRVLLVDDDEIDRESLARHIDEIGLPYTLTALGSKPGGPGRPRGTGIRYRTFGF